jgi:hypothetical protein
LHGRNVLVGHLILVSLLLRFEECPRARDKMRGVIMEHDEFENQHEARSEAAGKSERARERAAAAAPPTADQIGTRIKTFAGRVREGGPRVESKIHDSATRLADALDRGASYFTERQYEDTTRKITQCIRRNPGTSLLIGVAAGVLLALRRRRWS